MERKPHEALAHRKSGLRAALAAAALAVGIGIAAWTPWNAPISVSDDLSPSEQAARASAFAQAGALQVEEVPQQELATAVAALSLAPKEAAALLEAVQNDREELVYITLWDDVAEDGDVVELSSNGLTISVGIRHAPRRVAVPMPKQGVVFITGIYDGGGGITIAAESDGARVALPYLMTGQRMGIPVRR